MRVSQTPVLLHYDKHNCSLVMLVLKQDLDCVVQCWISHFLSHIHPILGPNVI